MNQVNGTNTALYINNLCTGNEAKVLYSILFCGVNTKDNTDDIVRMSGFSKNHFYTIRKKLYDKGLLDAMGSNYLVNVYALENIYKEKFKC